MLRSEKYFYSIFTATVTGLQIWNILKPVDLSNIEQAEAEGVYHFDAEDAAKGICTADEIGTFTTKEDLAERCKKAIASDADRYYNGQCI